MRKYLIAASFVFSFGIVGAVVSQPALAQVSQADMMAPDDAAEPRQNSWYGEAFAMDGIDVVSFFQETGPVTGTEKYTVEWDNTEWRFSSEENRDLFQADPERFTPQFGGYCPVALSRGEVLVGSAQHHVVVDDRLYVNLDEGSANLFRNETGRFIAEAKINF